VGAANRTTGQPDIDPAPDLLGCFDLDGICLWATDHGAKSLLGLPARDLVGESFYSFIHPEDFTAVSTAHESVRERLGWLEGAEHRFRHSNGEYRWVETRGRQAFSADGRPVILTATRSIEAPLDPGESSGLRADLYRALGHHQGVTDFFVNGWVDALTMEDLDTGDFWASPEYGRLLGYTTRQSPPAAREYSTSRCVVEDADGVLRTLRTRWLEFETPGAGRRRLAAHQRVSGTSG